MYLSICVSGVVLDSKATPFIHLIWEETLRNHIFEIKITLKEPNLHRINIGNTQYIAWYLWHRIRKCVAHKRHVVFFCTIRCAYTTAFQILFWNTQNNWVISVCVTRNRCSAISNCWNKYMLDVLSLKKNVVYCSDLSVPYQMVIPDGAKKSLEDTFYFW